MRFVGYDDIFHKKLDLVLNLRQTSLACGSIPSRHDKISKSSPPVFRVPLLPCKSIQMSMHISVPALDHWPLMKNRQTPEKSIKNGEGKEECKNGVQKVLSAGS
ncbi:uncharacterized protein G2W53_011893 [Senna tora]|uniref:Uncharacterized protein n=1 Tax=Senna tora TaxID=362788 RepID=A0A834TVY5_9FABA|nr:uncharacterized protein G2W53_011893 [Senna tora]